MALYKKNSTKILKHLQKKNLQKYKNIYKKCKKKKKSTKPKKI